MISKEFDYCVNSSKLYGGESKKSKEENGEIILKSQDSGLLWFFLLL